MSEGLDNERHFDGERSPRQLAELESLARRLEHERPVPRASFRGELRRRLLDAADRRPWRPQPLRFVIAAYAGSGAALLAIAALGVAGAGPLAAG